MRLALLTIVGGATPNENWPVFAFKQIRRELRALARLFSVALNEVAVRVGTRCNHAISMGCCPVRARARRASDTSFLDWNTAMKTSIKITAALLAVLLLASCGNTIRGLGRDTSNTVDATQDAAKDVAE